MNLFIDLQGLQTPGSRDRGIGRYSRDLTTALCAALKHDDRVVLAWNHLLDNPLRRLNLEPLTSDSAAVISFPYGAVRGKPYHLTRYDSRQLLNNRLYHYAVARSECDHLLFTSLMEQDEVNFVRPTHLNFAPNAISYSIIYDIIPHIFPGEYLRTPGIHSYYYSQLNIALGADVIFTISTQSKKDITQYFAIDPDRVVNIGAGIDISQFQIPNDLKAPTLAQQLGLSQAFLLFLGGDEFRKNLPGFIRAYCLLPFKLRQGLGMLVVGKVSDKSKESVKSILQQHGLSETVIKYIEHFPQANLVQAYHEAAAVVCPSFYEGFGLPVLEAMACGATVVASDGTSFSELLQDTSFLFDPEDPQNIADVISFALTHPSRLQELKGSYESTLSQHKWTNVVERALATMQGGADKRAATVSAIESSLPALNIAFAVTNDLDPAAVATISTLARHHNVKVYFETMSPEIDRLPVETDHLSNLWKHADADTPVFHLARVTQDLLRMRERYPVFNMIAIMSETGDISSADVKELNYYDVWQSCPDNLLSKIRKACGVYRIAGPYSLARDLTRITKAAGLGSSYKKKLAESAEITTFGSQPLGERAPKKAL